MVTNAIRLNSPTFELRNEQGAFNIHIELFEHSVLRSVLPESNGREAALRQLAKALLRRSSIRRFDMAPSVATTVHNDLSGYVGPPPEMEDVAGVSRMRWQRNVPQCGR